MQRFYIFVAVFGASVLASAGVLSSVLFSLTPDRPDTGDGPPPRPGILERVVQEREVVDEKQEVVEKKQEMVDFRLINFINQFRTYESQLALSVQQLESTLRMQQAPLRSAAQNFNMAVRQLGGYNSKFEAEMEYYNQMAGRMGALDIKVEPPQWDPSYLNKAHAAKGEFGIAATQFMDAMENARLEANMNLSRLQQEIIGTLNNLASLQVESLSNQSEMLGLYEQLINFVKRFGRLAGNPVALPANVQPGRFTGEAWRVLLDTMLIQTRSGMSVDAVAESAMNNIKADGVIQRALENDTRHLQ